MNQAAGLFRLVLLFLHTQYFPSLAGHNQVNNFRVLQYWHQSSYRYSAGGMSKIVSHSLRGGFKTSEEEEEERLAAEYDELLEV